MLSRSKQVVERNTIIDFSLLIHIIYIKHVII